MAGNWKMNLNHQEAVVLVQKLAWTLSDKKHDYGKAEVVVVPPFTDIRSVQTLVDGDHLDIKYGAQDISEHDDGAYTGEISAAMLAKLGCSYVVVGHSERREYHAESDDARQRQGAQGARRRHDARSCASARGSRSARRATTCPTRWRQVDGSLAGLHRRAGGRAGRRLRAGVGDRHRRGRHARGRPGGLRGDPRPGAEVHGDAAADGVRILYGGSVKAANVAGIMAKDDVDGCLVGGASLQVDEFGGICRFYDMPVL